jgi:hypothetical protein
MGVAYCLQARKSMIMVKVELLRIYDKQKKAAIKAAE